MSYEPNVNFILDETYCANCYPIKVRSISLITTRLHMAISETYDNLLATLRAYILSIWGIRHKISEILPYMSLKVIRFVILYVKCVTVRKK